MQRHFEWSNEAVSDLRRIHRFLQPKSKRSADRAVATIRASITVLLDFPEAGRLPPDSRIDSREFLVPFGDSGYVVAYVCVHDAVRILDIRHQRKAGY